jgi:iron complex transport system ATP-binding protein
MEAILSIQDATFSYDQRRDIFNGLNLEVKKGEVLCLLGSNGCGKTTLLRCIGGILKLKRGRIALENEDITRMKVTDIAKRIGFVFQEHSAPFPYPVIDVVSMGRAPHLGMFSAPSVHDLTLAEKALETVGILKMRNERYTQISGGERQLVLIARTLAQSPDIILLDEPTSHLDFKNQASILNIIKNLSGKGLTIVMTSHLPNHAWMLKSRVAMMNQRGLIATGMADEIMTEENLSQTYDAPIKVYEAIRDDRRVKYCEPEM